MQDIQFAAPLPLLGIAATVGGYTVMEAREDLMTCRVTEGLTEDAVTARLHEGGHPQALEYQPPSELTEHDESTVRYVEILYISPI